LKSKTQLSFFVLLDFDLWCLGLFFFLANFIYSHLVILSKFNDLVDKSKLGGRDCTAKA